MWRFLRSYGLALLIVAGIAAWMLTGTLIQGGRGPGEGERPMVDVVEGEGGPLRGLLEALGLIAPEEEPEVAALTLAEEAEEQHALPLVRVAAFSAEDLPEIVQLRGRTQANASVAVRAETNGTVREVHVTKGQRVAEGDLICTLDQGTRLARLSTAQAQLAQAQADLESNVALRDRGIAPANTARQFEVALLAAQAGLDDAQAELDRTEIRAQTAGIVQDPLATVGASLSAGGECATIVQLDPMIFIAEVPEARVGSMEVGEQAMVTTVTGQQVVGAVRFIASVANPASRTFTVEIEVPNPTGIIRDGVTAEAIVQVGTLRAHLLPQSVLTLDTDGTIGVRAVQDETVAFYPVQIARDTRDGIWVTGLPDEIDIITVGQEYVQAGQTVAVGRADEA
ncbi:efflux RND transporter periplasmic adaptor subunit [Pelagibacterium limicola]|uniref:efflux RND transporter periplasmic adaptor subunit n=1 Tax=Pelagibacterium limicola TaxID=2791022 RepID=UPI0018AF5483|nr:efflux RND transporter periplasmic adaptor subunit [Pelagibacterium limicola]